MFFIIHTSRSVLKRKSLFEITNKTLQKNLGTPENPLEPQDNCQPQVVEDGGDGVMACICTDDFCNGYKNENTENGNSNFV
jgi:hypothetical protein